MHTVFVFLVCIRHQSAVILIVQDAVVVVIVVAFVSASVLIGVQLGAVDDGGTVVFAVLSSVSITGTQTKVDSKNLKKEKRAKKANLALYLSMFVSHVSPTRSLSASDLLTRKTKMKQSVPWYLYDL